MLMPVLCMGSTMNAFEQWDAWMNTGARRMGAYFYHDDQHYFIMPKMDIHQSAKRIRYMVASGRARHFYQEMYPFWPLDAMVPYVESELLWDPRQDVDAILEEYYAKFFGPAAEPMKGFYEALERGYERWVEEEDVAHWHGKDRGSLSYGRSFGQFKVLNSAEADEAEAYLEKAAAAAKNDAAVRQRIDIVGRLFRFAALGARQYWAMERLGNAEVGSLEDAEEVIADARKAVALSRAQAKYKTEVMEKPPASIYAVFSKHTSTNTFYDCIGEGTVHPQIVRAVTQGFAAVNRFLRQRLDAAGAAQWWHRHRQAANDPVLAGALGMAETKARGERLLNLVKDPSFEKRGAGISPRTGRPLEPDHEVERGLHLWHRRGTPFSWALTDEDAHTGKYSVVFIESTRAVLSESVAAKPDARFHLSVWIKHNDKKGIYRVVVLPRSKEGKLPEATINVPFKPDEWQKVETDFTAPVGAKSITLHVFAIGQTPRAKVWIDDLFIGRYPE